MSAGSYRRLWPILYDLGPTPLLSHAYSVPGVILRNAAVCRCVHRLAMSSIAITPFLLYPRWHWISLTSSATVQVNALSCQQVW